MPKPRTRPQKPASVQLHDDSSSEARPIRSTLGPAATGVPGAGGIFKSAAVEVLRMERRLMTTGEITKIALQRGFLQAQGKTPEATMASALYTDVKKKNASSIFTRPQEGLFGLREWIAEGFFPEGWWAGGGPQMDYGDVKIPTANGSYQRRRNVTQHRVMQRGPDGQIVTTISGIPATPPAHEEVQPGVAGGIHAIMVGAGQAAAGATPCGKRGAGARAARSGTQVQGKGSATPSAKGSMEASDEDGSDHYNAGAEDNSGDAAAAGSGGGATTSNDNTGSNSGRAGRSGAAAAAAVAEELDTAAGTDCGEAAADPLFLLGEAALAHSDEAAPGQDEAAEAPAAAVGAACAAKGTIAAATEVDEAPPSEKRAAQKRPALEVGDNDDVEDGGLDATPASAAAADCGTARRGADRLLALHDVATSPLPFAAKTYVEGTGICAQQQRKRQQISNLTVAIPGGGEGAGAGGGDGGGEDQERIAAAMLGHMAGMASCDAYYRGGAASATEHMQRRPQQQQQQQQQQQPEPQQLAMQHQMQMQLEHDQQQQALVDWQMMGWPWAGMVSAVSHAGGHKGQWPGNMFSPMGFYDPTSHMSTPAAGFDATMAAAAPGMTVGGDLLHQMSLSFGLTPPAPLSAALPSVTGRPSQSQLPGHITLELASPHGAATGRRAPKRARTANDDCAAEASASPATQLLNAKTLHDLSKLDEWQATIESAEKALGRDHPAVGRAWMDLAKALQSVALHSDRARMATKRAFDVVLAATKNGAAGESFKYLLSRYMEQRQQQQMQEQEVGLAAAAAQEQEQPQQEEGAAPQQREVQEEQEQEEPAQEEHDQRQVRALEQEQQRCGMPCEEQRAMATGLPEALHTAMEVH